MNTINRQKKFNIFLLLTCLLTPYLGFAKKSNQYSISGARFRFYEKNKEIAFHPQTSKRGSANDYHTWMFTVRYAGIDKKINLNSVNNPSLIKNVCVEGTSEQIANYFKYDSNSIIVMDHSNTQTAGKPTEVFMGYFKDDRYIKYDKKTVENELDAIVLSTFHRERQNWGLVTIKACPRSKSKIIASKPVVIQNHKTNSNVSLKSTKPQIQPQKQIMKKSPIKIDNLVFARPANDQYGVIDDSLTYLSGRIDFNGNDEQFAKLEFYAVQKTFESMNETYTAYLQRCDDIIQLGLVNNACNASPIVNNINQVQSKKVSLKIIDSGLRPLELKYNFSNGKIVDQYGRVLGKIIFSKQNNTEELRTDIFAQLGAVKLNNLRYVDFNNMTVQLAR